MLNTFILVVVLFNIVVSFLFAAETEILIIPGGQGNFSVVKYGSQSIIIDAGSSEMTFSAVYNKKATQEVQTYQLKPSSLVRNVEINIQTRTDLDHKQDSDETSSNPSSESSEEEGKKRSLSKKAKPETKKKKAKEDYEEDTLKTARYLFSKATDGSFLVKTIIISHADKDHYNLLPKLFDELNPVIIDTLILGGFAADYEPVFIEWVKRQRITKIIYTGNLTGHETDTGMGIWPDSGYARSYCSKFLPATKAEDDILSALRFDPEASSEPPVIEILSMNAGHAMEEIIHDGSIHKIVRRSNYDKNANSIVLRITANNKSMIFSGDADKVTWDHILTNYIFERANLRTDYLLISHHGSKEDGATRRDVLDIMQPKACILSVGRHLGYHHPHQENLDLLLSPDSRLYTIPAYHAVSYFGHDLEDPKKFIHKSKKTKRAIFSTLNSGIISIPLGERFEVRVSQAKEMIYTDQANSEHKFSIDYSQVLFPSKGETIEHLMIKFMEAVPDRKKVFSVWETVDSEDKTIKLYQYIDNTTGISLPPDELGIHYNLLLDRSNNRIYILESID